MKKVGIILLILAVPIVLISVFMVDWHFPKIGGDAREANKYDLLFFNTAVANNDPSFCEKIYPEAYLTAAWGRGGQEVQYTKSNCYLTIAVNTRDAMLCSNIEPISTWFLDGSGMNEQNCKKDIQKFLDSGSKSTPYGTTAIPSVDSENLFFELGYTYDMIPQMYWDEYGPDREFVLKIYLNDIYTTENFKGRVNKLPNSIK